MLTPLTLFLSVLFGVLACCCCWFLDISLPIVTPLTPLTLVLPLLLLLKLPRFLLVQLPSPPPPDDEGLAPIGVFGAVFSLDGC